MASRLTPEQEANYYQSKQPAIVATCVIFLILCNASVLVRILSQWRISKRLFIDDFAIIFAAVCSAEAELALWKTDGYQALFRCNRGFVLEW